MPSCTHYPNLPDATSEESPSLFLCFSTAKPKLRGGRVVVVEEGSSVPGQQPHHGDSSESCCCFLLPHRFVFFFLPPPPFSSCQLAGAQSSICCSSKDGSKFLARGGKSDRVLRDKIRQWQRGKMPNMAFYKCI